MIDSPTLYPAFAFAFAFAFASFSTVGVLFLTDLPPTFDLYPVNIFPSINVNGHVSVICSSFLNISSSTEILPHLIMDGVNHLRSAQTTVGKRKQEDHGDLAPAKRVKPNAELSLPHLPTPNRSPSLVETATSPPTSVESSSSDGSSSCDTDVRLPPPYPNASGAFSIHPSAIDREGIHKPESVCGFGSRATSTTSSDTDSSDSDSSSELATVVSDRVILMPSSSNLPFPSSQHALTSQNLTNLQKRLSAFLPTLYTANQALEIDRAEGRLGDRNVEVVSNEEEPYIEMVRAEKKPSHRSAVMGEHVGPMDEQG